MSNFDLMRAKRAVESRGQSEIFIIAGNLTDAKYFEDRIRKHSEINKDVRIKSISNNAYALDGQIFTETIVFLCGYWWKNRNAIKFMESFIKLPKLVIPITHIPAKGSFEGGENNKRE